VSKNPVFSNSTTGGGHYRGFFYFWSKIPLLQGVHHTTMIYLDVNIEQIEKAIDFLDDPGEIKEAKKWKSNLNNLASFCGLK